jgi:hypothetical protein
LFYQGSPPTTDLQHDFELYPLTIIYGDVYDNTNAAPIFGASIIVTNNAGIQLASTTSNHEGVFGVYTSRELTAEDYPISSHFTKNAAASKRSYGFKAKMIY